MKADMSGARTTPKLLELQEECLARDLSSGAVSSSDESSDDDFDADAIPGLASLQGPLIPAALRDHVSDVEIGTGQDGADQAGNDDSDETNDEGSIQSGSDTLQSGVDVKADRKAHKKAVKEANRERRKHKMPKHVKKKKMMKSHKK